MTVHLISVGRSVLDALEKEPGKFASQSGLVEAIRAERPQDLLADMRSEQASDWLAGALAAPGEPGRDHGHGQHLAALAGRLHPELWPSNVSAETATFARACGTGDSLARTDIAILICSDTAAGLTAGLWNALMLASADFARVRYLPAPGALLGSAAKPPAKIRGSAVVVRVPGMDAGSPGGFREAMGGLGLLARHLFALGELEPAEPFRFYLSGGFKAAIPYLIGLAEAVRSLDAQSLNDLGAGHLMPAGGRPYPVDAFVLHETDTTGTPIPLPLRRLIASAVTGELTGYNQALRREGKPSPALLEGYAYEVSGRPGREICELTAFGVGLRALFGVSGEVYAG